ncbi:MAG TPA: dienelactone hydrolase family protein [Terracidiphilus sp.]|nr:dienelactone hydrolase family protein [Terracidiphilus sp.]
MKSFRLPAVFAALLVAAFALPIHAQQHVTFPSGSGTGEGILYLPHTPGPHPAIVVIHEWWGLTDWIKQQAAGYAAHGYVALAVDLYHGQVTTDPAVALKLAQGLPQDQGIRDLVSAVHFLQARKDVDPQRIGAVGWCFGGGYALQLAIADPDLKAAAINYGRLTTNPADLTRIHAALLGNFGALDRGIPPTAVHAFIDSMHAVGKSIDVKIYPDANHAFENPYDTKVYRQKDSADALARIDRFFAAHLQ